MASEKESEKPTGINQRDMEILFGALQCLKAPLQVDTDALAKKLNSKNRHVASTQLAAVKKEYNIGVPVSDSATTTPTGSPEGSAAGKGSPRNASTPRKRKAAAPTNGVMTGSPLKKSKIVDQDQDQDEDRYADRDATLLQLLKGADDGADEGEA
ncbi:Uu.00g083700.m01.CDS01 [Anthostomella pinea]|uniref:Uu.00g083700.m01.CDS01 n=1 Tax=Anthostomella pinea TaxID=933095 RepID=A0AAI8YH83_9PEZI|nr:Uu.00g083700.m01.CDS01 [Anthostomella pinea]